MTIRSRPSTPEYRDNFDRAFGNESDGDCRTSYCHGCRLEHKLVACRPEICSGKRIVAPELVETVSQPFYGGMAGAV